MAGKTPHPAVVLTPHQNTHTHTNALEFHRHNLWLSERSSWLHSYKLEL